MKKSVVAVGLALGIASGSALAQGFDQKNVYVGGGIGLNSVSGADDAVGFQVFAGYKLDMVKLDPIELAVEVGYMDSGDFEVDTPFGSFEESAEGLWATAVGSYALDKQFNLLGRFGLDFGDDDGLMLGIGAGYEVSPQIELRAEYAIRDDIDSLQGNFLYHF